jgi:hypothetical protein
MFPEILFVVVIGAIVVGVCGLSVNIIRVVSAYRELGASARVEHSSVGSAGATVHVEAVLNDSEQNEHLAIAGVTLAPKLLNLGDGLGWYAVYMPRWRGSHFLKDAALVRTLQIELLNTLSSLPVSKRPVLYAVTTPAAWFLRRMLPELAQLQVECVSALSIREDSDSVVLFDLVVNTGRTMKEIYDEIGHLVGRNPVGVYTLLFNDFIPYRYRSSSEMWIYDLIVGSNGRGESWCAVRVKDLLPYFSPPLAEHLLNARRVLQTDVIREETQAAVRNLRTAWVEGNLSIEP